MADPEGREHPRRPEDIYDELEFTPIRWALKYAWSVAEPVFKLTGWLLLCGAIVALGKKTENIVIYVAGATLTVIWFAAFASQMFKATGFIQDAARNRWWPSDDAGLLKQFFVNLVILIVFVFPMAQLFGALVGVAMTVLDQVVDPSQWKSQ